MHQPFSYRNLEELRGDMDRLGVTIPTQEDFDILKQPLQIGGKWIPNRLGIHPMEGCDGTEDGKPGPLTYRRYDRFARGGAGLLWFEATAVVPEGRANPRQLSINAGTKAALKELLEKALQAAKEEHGDAFRPYTVLQLTHSGRYSKPDILHPILAVRNPILEAKLPEAFTIISDEELEQLEDKFVEAAELAAEIGFDAVDVKSCHRYLVSELLSAHTREGKYGGSFPNRIRFLCNVVEKISAKLGSRIDIAVRMNAYDAMPYPYGWGVDKDNFRKPDMSEPVELARRLRDKGVKLINVTAGNPYFNPHVNRPYDVGGYIPPFHPLENTETLLSMGKQIQAAVPEVLVMGTGFSWLRQLAANVAAGTVGQGWFAIAGFGRQAFAYPDFAKDIIQKGAMDLQKVCLACSKCSVIMRDGGQSGCVLRDTTTYLAIYREGREGKPVFETKEVAEHV
jgi:2,4-dienoyl-CoA reductase-like NADH-dependent reductase (Old Yellow Enzyme family)